MGLPTPARIALYTAAFAGASLLACPVVSAAAWGGAVVGAIGSLAGNALASDVHAAFTAGKLDSLHNHHLQKLTGSAVALLIELYEKDKADSKSPDFVDRLVGLFRRGDGRLTALARAARKHWEKLDLAGESGRLQDTRLHEIFSDRDRASTEAYISAEEWDGHLETLARHAVTWYREPVPYVTGDHRRPLAEYIAPRFATAVRELVKADLDPGVGTGGRVFVAIHLDLMRAMAAGIRALDEKSDEHLEKLRVLQDGFDALRREIADKLDPAQKDEYFGLLDDVRAEVQATRQVLGQKIDALHARIDAITRDTAALIDGQRDQATSIAALCDMLRRTEPLPPKPPALPSKMAAPENNLAYLILRREKSDRRRHRFLWGFGMFNDCFDYTTDFQIFLNGALVGQLANGGELFIKTRPGKHVLRAYVEYSYCYDGGEGGIQDATIEAKSNELGFDATPGENVFSFRYRDGHVEDNMLNGGTAVLLTVLESDTATQVSVIR